MFCLYSPVPVDLLKGAILQADLEVDPAKMEKYIKWVYKSETPYETDPIEQSQVIERLQNLDISHSSKNL